MIARFPTGAKIFILLSVALLPLAIIAVFASLKTTQGIDREASAVLRVAASEVARTLSDAIVGDVAALRVAAVALSEDHSDQATCARALAVFARHGRQGPTFAIADSANRLLCGQRPLANMQPMSSPGPVRIAPDRGIVASFALPNRQARAVALFPTGYLRMLSRGGGFMPALETRLSADGDSLTLTQLPPRGMLDRRKSLSMPLGVGAITLHATIRNPPITSPMIIGMLFPILMWAAAAGIGWFVVDRLLIRPLRQLRASVAAFRPGEEIDPAQLRALPAQEIRELGDTFRAISRTVAEHEAGLAAGLVRQTRLTREVHHRVKNNLQVIASLINFHARGARSAEASAAYASIQRRVDALSVVHRNHFAEMEENRGLSLRSVIGELASNIRATAPENSSQLGIVLEIDPFLVNQDIAIAVAFLITELVELAMSSGPTTQLRISVKPGDAPERAVLRVSSPSLVESDTLREHIAERYGRVIEGLSRQLRSRLHHDPLVGAYEIVIAVTGRD